jgi:hypothetical protein
MSAAHYTSDTLLLNSLFKDVVSLFYVIIVQPCNSTFFVCACAPVSFVKRARMWIGYNTRNTVPLKLSTVGYPVQINTDRTLSKYGKTYFLAVVEIGHLTQQ